MMMKLKVDLILRMLILMKKKMAMIVIKLLMIRLVTTLLILLILMVKMMKVLLEEQKKSMDVDYKYDTIEADGANDNIQTDNGIVLDNDDERK